MNIKYYETIKRLFTVCLATLLSLLFILPVPYAMASTDKIEFDLFSAPELIVNNQIIDLYVIDNRIQNTGLVRSIQSKEGIYDYYVWQTISTQKPPEIGAND